MPLLQYSVVDSVSVSDVVIAPLSIANARALTATRVRLDFSKPTVVNDALVLPANYTIVGAAPGAIGVLVLAVRVPSGQIYPSYVELDVTEHTHDKLYAVAMSPAIRDVQNGIGAGTFVTYLGIGIAPTLVLVIAKSPTEVQVHFSETIVNNATVQQVDRYRWDNELSTVAVKSVSGSIVTLQTTPQLPGVLYRLSVMGANPQGSNSDVLVVTDTLRVVKNFNTRLSDALIVTDKISRAFPVARERADTVVVSDALSRRATFLRKHNDSIVVAESLTVADFKPLIVFAGNRPGPTPAPEIQIAKSVSAWQPAMFPNSGRIARAGAAHSNTGKWLALVGDAGLCLLSTDGGFSWTASGATLPPGFNAKAVWSDPLGWWVAGDNPSGLYRTNSSMLNPWIFVDLPGGDEVPEAGIFYGYGNFGGHIVTGRSGAIWSRAWADGSEQPWIRRTADQGYMGNFHCATVVLSQMNGDQMFVAGDAGEIQSTYDFGASWTRIASDGAQTLYGMTAWTPESFGEDPIIVAVGSSASGALIIRFDPNNGPMIAAPIPGSVALRGATVRGNSYFVAVGDNGLVVASGVTDGSNTWGAYTPANTGGNFVGHADSDINTVIVSR